MANTFRRFKILKPNGFVRMVTSDLVASKEADEKSINTENWCSCIDGALTKENYVDAIRKGGFANVEVLD